MPAEAMTCASPKYERIGAVAENAMPSLEFRGVVVENGTVLRHWRPAAPGTQSPLVAAIARLEGADSDVWILAG